MRLNAEHRQKLREALKKMSPRPWTVVDPKSDAEEPYIGFELEPRGRWWDQDSSVLTPDNADGIALLGNMSDDILDDLDEALTALSEIRRLICEDDFNHDTAEAKVTRFMEAIRVCKTSLQLDSSRETVEGS